MDGRPGGIPVVVSCDVLQVVTDRDRRGAQTFALELDGALAARGWRVRTVALAPGVGSGGLDVEVLGHRPRGPGTLVRLQRHMRAAGVTIAHGSTTLPACAMAAVRSRAPFVYRSIGDPLYWAGSRGRRLRVRAALGRATAVAALWSGSARVLVEHFGVSHSRVWVIPNGVPRERFPPVDRTLRRTARASLGLDPGAPTLGYVGALTPEKGLGTGVDALARLPACQLVIAGDGPLETALRARADRVAPGRVHFLGPVDRPQDVFAAVDVVILPSLSEGMPGVLIEAGLSGVPAVATRVGGVPDVIVPGRTGELVDPDDPNTLAAAVRSVLPTADRMGDAAREHCLARFELATVADAWDRMLRRAVQPSPSVGVV